MFVFLPTIFVLLETFYLLTWYNQLQTREDFSPDQRQAPPMTACIVSSPGPDTVYIFPLQAVKHSQFSQLRGMIRTRWNPEQADIWCSMIEQTNILESPQNLIRLDPQLHWYFNNGEMAMKPLRKTDDGSVVVQFHWLKRHHVAPSDTLRGINMDEWIRRAGLADNSAWGDNISGLPVETGQTFVLQKTLHTFQVSNSYNYPGICSVSWLSVALLDWKVRIIVVAMDVFIKTDSGIWSEDDYAQLRS